MYVTQTMEESLHSANGSDESHRDLGEKGMTMSLLRGLTASECQYQLLTFFQPT